MPGLFDNSSPGSGILGGLTATLFPGIYHQQVRDQAIQAYKQSGFNDSDAQMAVNNPEMFQQLYQQRLFEQQLKEQGGKSVTEKLYNIQHPGPQPFGHYTDPSGLSGPGIQQGFQVTPPFSGINTPQQPQPVPQSTTPQPPQVSETPQQRSIKYKSELAGAEETARKQADRLDQYPTALADAQDTVSELENFRDNPNRPSIIGGLFGGIGRLGPIGRTQADLVNKNDALQSKIMNNLRTLGSVAGRQMTPGMMKELSVGAGDLIAGRKGTVEGHTEIINNAIDLIKKNTQAAWEATGKKGAEPTWGQSSPATPKQNYAEGTVIVNKQTGEHRVMRAGQWAKP